MKEQISCIAQIGEIFANPTSISNEQIEDILLHLCDSEDLAKHLDSSTDIFSSQCQESSFFSDALMITDNIYALDSLRKMDLFFKCSSDGFEYVIEEIENEMHMEDIVLELGYGCTVNTSHCKAVLSHFQPLNEVKLCKLLGRIAHTYTGLEDTQFIYTTFTFVLNNGLISDTPVPASWNIDVLVDSIKQLAPETNWTTVMENLDYEGFIIPGASTFSVLMAVYAKACQDPFPLHAVCGSLWKNADGQISFLKYAIAAPPEVFTFAHCSRKLTYPESLRPSNGQGNQAWLSLDLLETLCQLAERGHVSPIWSMLEYPISHCPEVLLIGIAQISTSYNLLQSEVFSNVLPSLLKSSTNSAIVQFLCHVNPGLLLRGFVDANTDPSSIFRILDICQDFKILSPVLDTAPLSFSMKLAAIASMKGQINLEQWLHENLNAYKDALFVECLKFLRVHIDMASNIPDSSLQQSQSDVLIAYQETSPIIFKVLQSYSGKLASPQLLEEFKSLHGSLNTQTLSNVTADLTVPEGSSDDIEAEANAFFHQMFSGQLSIEAIVETLGRFKESSEKRERLIFDCMIANLFEEYKFFPKYPDKQLKLAAVLFGSLIKHQLVTHVALGIALRGVLDALRKSVDSKMFVFGTKALEQFMDRLVEWPQYCNHILQISHLRGTHSELVSIIERTLARISSSQSESNGSSSFPVDQQHDSPAMSVENMEGPFEGKKHAFCVEAVRLKKLGPRQGPFEAKKHAFYAEAVRLNTLRPSEGSWQLISPSSAQLGQQVSPFQLQQKHQGFLTESPKITAASASYSLPHFSHAGQSSIVSAPVDSVASHKINASQSLQAPSPQQSASITSAVSSSPGFLRSSRSIISTGIPRQPSYNTGFGAALNIETLVAAAEQRDNQIEAPASEVQDKIYFIINNISNANMDAKANEFTEVLKEQYYSWFAQYMVMKRASIEPNFHDVYLKFLDKVNSKPLNKEVVKATYENCKVLLRSDLIKSSSEERSLLKNLGSWLGKFTIGRNQALLAKEIDPKVLIVEAYEKGLMIAVIPFTSKILEPCQCSLAYRPPNPWTMGILGLLVEIYNLPNLKMNLKFDIEVLFKNLTVDMKTVIPTSLLKDRIREVEGNPDFSNKELTSSQPLVIAEVNSGIISSASQLDLQAEVNTSHPASHPNVPTQYTSPFHLPPNAVVEDDKSLPLIIPERVPSAQSLPQVASSPPSLSLNQLRNTSNYDSYININPKLSSMGSQLPFHRAITEIVSPVIQRSVTIASRTTKELVLKDYAFESDYSVICRHARLMVGALAGSIAHVTCKEPLRVALSNHLRRFLQNLNVNNERDQIVQILTTDHLDLGCAVIEDAASKKAVSLIDGEISQSLKQRELVGSSYYDAATYAQGPFALVPEALRPKPGRLSGAQQRVYEDFIQKLSPSQPSQNANVLPTGPPGMAGSLVNSSVPRVYGSSSGQSNCSMFSAPQGASGFSSIAQQFDLISDDTDRNSGPLLSDSSANVGTSDRGIQLSAEVNHITPTFPVVTSSELHLVESSTGTKELGDVAPLSSVTSGTEHSAVSEPLLTTGDALEKYQQVAQMLETLISKDARDADVQGVADEVVDIIQKCINRDEAALAIAQKVFKSLFESAINSIHIASHIALLDAIRDVCKLLVKEMTNWVIFLDDDRRFNKEIIIGLINSDLLNLAEYNIHIAKLMDGGRNKTATEFAVSFIRALLFHEPGFNTSEVYNVMDVLTKLAMKPGAPESLQQLIEMARNPASSVTGFAANKEEKARQSRDNKILVGHSLTTREEYNVNDSSLADHPGLHEKATHFFDEWCRICDLPATADTTYSHYISQFQQYGWVKGDDVTERVFRFLTVLSVSRCVPADQGITPLQSTQQLQNLSFYAVDAYAKLVALVLKYCSVDQASNKAFLLSKILSVTIKVIQKDADDKRTSFNSRPYFRLFINWLLDLSSADPVPDGTNVQVLTSFATAFHALQPLKVPGWSFAWLELVSHRSFMPKLLAINSQKGWPFFQRLLVDLFKFMEPYLRSAELGEPVHFLYKGTLRVLLVLLHDFPEFLCDYHFSFCDVIPPSCIQMRNVILSAFPRNMRLPDPSTPNLKIDLLAEISQPPHILSDVDGALKVKQIKHDIDEYLKTRPEGSTFLTELKQRLLLPQSETSLAGTHYNVSLINSLVLYVGMQAIQQLQSKSASQHAPAQQMSHTPPMDIFLVGAAMDIFQSLIKNLDSEGRYLFLNAVANQLRYPNNHTHYFSFVLLYLFAEVSQDIIQEQITRVLLERLIVNRPHPWGLLITFIELIKNPRYNFWNRPFTRCAPEIEKLFESVSRSCGGPKTVDDGMVTGGGIPDGNH